MGKQDIWEKRVDSKESPRIKRKSGGRPAEFGREGCKKIKKILQLKLETRKSRKGVRGMPWLSEAKKDVTSCEKPRGGANGRRSADVRMGEPVMWKT